jgi:hypothetical protein
MKRASRTERLSSRGAQTPRDLATEFGANANGKRSTTPLRRIAAGSEEIDQSVRGPSPSARLGMTRITA